MMAMYELTFNTGESCAFFSKLHDRAYSSVCFVVAAAAPSSRFLFEGTLNETAPDELPPPLMMPTCSLLSPNLGLNLTAIRQSMSDLAQVVVAAATATTIVVCARSV